MVEAARPCKIYPPQTAIQRERAASQSSGQPRLVDGGGFRTVGSPARPVAGNWETLLVSWYLANGIRRVLKTGVSYTVSLARPRSACCALTVVRCAVHTHTRTHSHSNHARQGLRDERPMAQRQQASKQAKQSNSKQTSLSTARSKLVVTAMCQQGTGQ